MLRFAVLIAILFTIGCTGSRDNPQRSAEKNELHENRQPEKPVEAFEKLIADYSEAANAYFAKLNSAQSNEERKALQSQRPDVAKVVIEGLGIYAGKEDDPSFVRLVKFIVYNAPDQSELSDALLELAEHHSDDKTVAEICLDLRNLQDKPEATLTFVQKVAEISKTAEIKAAAQLAQASLLDEAQDQERIVQLLQTVKASAKGVVLAGVDLEKDADDRLFRVTLTGIGQVAPDIEGEDAEGTNFKLSDYRGKVVMLSFWADW